MSVIALQEFLNLFKQRQVHQVFLSLPFPMSISISHLLSNVVDFTKLSAFPLKHTFFTDDDHDDKSYSFTLSSNLNVVFS